ncbi:MAG: hypothetical protein MRY78_08885 [Saprospiraceae bacterium]|nr:hypothetical protein [Saprospiraceae bacterium]
MKNLLLAFSLITLSLFSCNREASESVDQDRIFTEYELFYNANQDKTFARATFKFSNALGTKLELSQPSEVTFNGDLLTFNPVLAYYEKEYAGLVETGTFEWTDTEGNVFKNNIEIHSIDYANTIDTIDRSGSYELNFSGTPLEMLELVTVTINGENELDAQVFTTNDSGSQSIILSKSKLEKIGDGPGTIIMDRSYIPLIQESTNAGGILLGRYRPENQSIQLK